MRNKISGKKLKPKPMPEANSKNFKEIVVSPVKMQEMLSELRPLL